MKKSKCLGLAKKNANLVVSKRLAFTIRHPLNLTSRVLKYPASYTIGAQTMVSFGLYIQWINEICIVARVKFESSEVKFLFSDFSVFFFFFFPVFLFVFVFWFKSLYKNDVPEVQERQKVTLNELDSCYV